MKPLKTVIFLLSILLVFVSCTKEEEENEHNDKLYLGYVTNRFSSVMDFRIVHIETGTVHYSYVLNPNYYVQVELPSGNFFVENKNNNEYLPYEEFNVSPANLNQYTFDNKQFTWRVVFDYQGIINGNGVTDIDGNFYPSVIVGSQEWMAENIRVTRDATGKDITRYCIILNGETNCDLYGGLYTWHTIMNGEESSSSNPSGIQGICPDGWHVPSDAEWMQLVNYVAAQGFPNSDEVNGAGNALKSCRQINSPEGGSCDTSEHPRWNSDNRHHGFDKFGFSAIPGSARLPDGEIANLGSIGYWWSSTERTHEAAWYRGMFHFNGSVEPWGYHKANSFSLRCVRN